MRLGIFASNKVGYETVAFLVQQQAEIAALVLDSSDTGSYNERILDTVRDLGDTLFFSNDFVSETTLDSLRRKRLDLIILAWWPYIIKDPLIKLPAIGCLNFHPSYLPYNRGKHYNFWTIVEDSPFGVTIHWVTNKVDGGDIAFQKLVEKSWQDTGETLYHKAQSAIVSLFQEKFQRIQNGDVPRIPQDQNMGTQHKAKELHEASHIDVDKSYSARDLLNILRARTFPPHPGAWFEDAGERYEVQVRITKVDNNERL
jgi:methionyl-tRNA formyltransferase